MQLIDSHCHLEVADFGDERDAVIARARDAGLVHFVVIGAGGSLAQIENAVALAEANADMSAAVGIHPHDVGRMPAGALEEALARVEDLAARHPRVVAVGETGLDYHYDLSPREAQQQAFRAFVRIARRTGKTLTVHIRDAHDDARRIVREEGGFEVPVVVHCFTGTPDDARAWIELGAYLSFSGILTFKNAAPLRQAAAEAPADRLLVETDCPYLAPIPHRGKRNEPAWVADTLRCLGDVRGLPPVEAAALTSANTVRAFRLPCP